MDHHLNNTTNHPWADRRAVRIQTMGTYLLSRAQQGTTRTTTWCISSQLKSKNKMKKSSEKKWSLNFIEKLSPKLSDLWNREFRKISINSFWSIRLIRRWGKKLILFLKRKVNFMKAVIRICLKHLLSWMWRELRGQVRSTPFPSRPLWSKFFKKSPTPNLF